MNMDPKGGGLEGHGHIPPSPFSMSPAPVVGAGQDSTVDSLGHKLLFAPEDADSSVSISYVTPSISL